jgi:hypothetical protein
MRVHRWEIEKNRPEFSLTSPRPRRDFSESARKKKKNEKMKKKGVFRCFWGVFSVKMGSGVDFCIKNARKMGFKAWEMIFLTVV